MQKIVVPQSDICGDDGGFSFEHSGSGSDIPQCLGHQGLGSDQSHRSIISGVYALPQQTGPDRVDNLLKWKKGTCVHHQRDLFLAGQRGLFAVWRVEIRTLRAY